VTGTGGVASSKHVLSQNEKAIADNPIFKTSQEKNEREAWKAAQSGWPNWK
jgi:hypothetical protein